MSRESTALIDEAAGDWLAKRDSENWSERDQQAFDAWLNESTLHRVAYLRIENAWDNALRLKALGAGVQSDRPPRPGRWNLSPFFTRRAGSAYFAEYTSKFRRSVIAASLVLAGAAGMAWFALPSSQHFETPIGGVASLPISDGSRITLNTDSEINVAITAKERRINLKHGEAFFEVARDPSRPFFVIAGGKRIVAVGTKFSVRHAVDHEADDIQVVVTEGAVRIESASGEGLGNISARPLTAGAVARTNRDGTLVQQKKLPEVEEQLAWRSGILIFRDVTLAEAVAEFNRYNERQIVIDDESTANLRVAGNFRTTNVDAFVRLLEQGYPVRTRVRDEKVVVAAR